MLANTMFRGLIAAMFLFVTACSDVLDGPTEEDLANQLAFELPAGVHVDGVDIIVSENIGSEVEPRYRNRAKATLRLAEDRVDAVEQYDDKFILKTVMEKGTEFNVTLISTSALMNEKWKVSYDKMEGTRITGVPLSQFIEGSYAYDGSDDATQIIADYEARVKAEKEAAAAEAERVYLEKVAAQEKAEAERVAKIKAFREFMTGTWISSQPVYRGRNLYVVDGNKTASLEITFPEGEGTSGVARVTLFVTDNITDDISVDANFAVSNSGDAATVYLNNRAQLRSLNWVFRGNWTFTQDGAFATQSGRDRWATQMVKGGEALAAKRAEEASIERRRNAIQTLVLKHKAFMGDKRFFDIGLKDNTYGPVFVDAEKAATGNVWGDAAYGGDSSVLSAALHAGVLKPGESGVLKVTRRRLNSRTEFPGMMKNGITSEGFHSRTAFELELVEKLHLN